jgi:ParB-like chromosome segregation protein Spo0J
MDATVIAALISALAGLVAAVASALTSRLQLDRKRSNAVDDGEAPDPERDVRLNEAREVLQCQETIARWYCRAAASLTFSQYIVGGILATSFVQESLSKEIVGFLGVLVLGSSLVHHRYRPDIQSREARQRAAQLRTVIRTAEDALFEIRKGKQGAPSMHKIRKMVSVGLTKIEAIELNDMEPEGAVEVGNQV